MTEMPTWSAYILTRSLCRRFAIMAILGVAILVLYCTLLLTTVVVAC
eukprot:SAG11_NODE_1450_length_4883_cov_2.373955_2_plen_47_part_00